MITGITQSSLPKNNSSGGVSSAASTPPPRKREQTLAEIQGTLSARGRNLAKITGGRDLSRSPEAPNPCRNVRSKALHKLAIIRSSSVSDQNGEYTWVCEKCVTVMNVIQCRCRNCGTRKPNRFFLERTEVRNNTALLRSDSTSTASAVETSGSESDSTHKAFYAPQACKTRVSPSRIAAAATAPEPALDGERSTPDDASPSREDLPADAQREYEIPRSRVSTRNRAVPESEDVSKPVGFNNAEVSASTREFTFRRPAPSTLKLELLLRDPSALAFPQGSLSESELAEEFQFSRSTRSKRKLETLVQDPIVPKPCDGDRPGKEAEKDFPMCTPHTIRRRRLV